MKPAVASSMTQSFPIPLRDYALFMAIIATMPVGSRTPSADPYRQDICFQAMLKDLSQ